MTYFVVLIHIQATLQATYTSNFTAYLAIFNKNVYHTIPSAIATQAIPSASHCPANPEGAQVLHRTLLPMKLYLETA